MTNTSTMAFHVKCSVQRRPSLFQNIDRFKTSLSSSYKPLLKELKQLSLQLEVSQIMKNASVKLLDAFVDSVFQFADQPTLPSQLRFGKVNKDLSNTNVFEHSGKFYSIAENHLPQEIDIFSLQTLGDWDINGAWHRPFNSHPKVVVRGCRSLESIISKSYGMDLEESEWVSGRLRSKEHVEQNTTPSSNDELLFSRSYEWRLNMETGEVKERNLTGTDLCMEFPMINPSLNGLKNKFGYTQIVHEPASSSSGMPKFGGLAKLYFDETSSKEGEQSEGHIKVEYHEFEGNTFCTGSAFVPKEGGREEDDGWIITFVHDEDTNTSKVYIIDTKNFTSEPVAKITLPYRVPYGFHGAFMPIPSHNELYNTSHINFVEKLTDLTRTLDAIKFKGF
ncbi:hypothetical protein Peur_009145 [Populus x canadensis]